MSVTKPVYLSADQWRTKIQIELNGGALLEQHLRLLWDANDRFSATPTVQYLKTKLDAIDLLLGNLDEQMSYPIVDDLKDRLTSRRIILLALRQTIQTELTRINYGANSAGPSMGVLTTNAPIPSDPGLPDANSITLIGNPNARTWPVVPP